MPNGGSDCCGTCWFNSNYKEKITKEGKIAKRKKGVPKSITKCLLRDIEISNPFWTYCANHPKHTYPDKIEIPIGPVYINDGYPYSRKIWLKPTDNENVRVKLIDILSKFTNKLNEKYPVPLNIEIETILQLVSYKEERAIEQLLRIANIDVKTYREKPHGMYNNKVVTVGLAAEGILKICKCKYLNKIEHLIKIGLDNYNPANYKEAKDNIGIIRYHFVRGLEFCDSAKSVELLKIAQNDPHSEIRAFANEILNKKKK